MASNNGYASLVKQRSSGKTKRRKLDDYETPPDETLLLCQHLPDLTGKVFEPASGSGRMARALKDHYGSKINLTTADIKRGHDFLKRTKTFDGHIITNPPYRDGLADAFVQQALKIADGRVCMLMESGYLFSEKRNENLYQVCPPEKVIIIPNRVYFFEGSGKQLKSQFYKHVWLVWPDRQTRGECNVRTDMIWPVDSLADALGF